MGCRLNGRETPYQFLPSKSATRSTMKSASSLIAGDDGLLAEEVGAWAIEKHNYLKRYLDISRAARKKFLGAGKAGATFIDLFGGTGRARIRETGQWIDGSAVSAWKIGQEGGSPFSEILVADIDQERRRACVQRLRRAGAPVRELSGSAIEAAKETMTTVNRYGLHFAFLDPYSLGELDFSIIQTLSQLKRIDMLIHLSVMDLQRNLERNVASLGGPLTHLPPGGEIPSISIRRSPKSGVLYLSIGAIKFPGLAQERRMTCVLSPEKKINGFIGCF